MNTPHLAIQNAWDDLLIKTIKYQVDWTLVRVHAILEENWEYKAWYLYGFYSALCALFTKEQGHDFMEEIEY